MATLRNCTLYPDNPHLCVSTIKYQYFQQYSQSKYLVSHQIVMIVIYITTILNLCDSLTCIIHLRQVQYAIIRYRQR